jgi:hypothetical protein
MVILLWFVCVWAKSLVRWAERDAAARSSGAVEAAA